MLRYIAGMAGLLLIGFTGTAQAQSYAQRSTPIRAGILIVESAQTNTTKQPINYTPYVWYNLDSDRTIKPAGWNIYNPSATTQVTQAVNKRWTDISTDLGGPIPPVGASLTKASAPYWEVRLSQAGDTQLSNFDVLLLSAYGYTSLNSIERDKLRKFVDAGGILWIDLSSTTNFGNATLNTFPVPIQTNVLGATALTDADPFSQLTTTPYELTLSNLEQLRVDTSSFIAPLPGSGITAWDIENWLATDYAMHFVPISGSGGNPNLVAGKLGDGYIVVTSSAYATALNRVATGGGAYNSNSQVYALPSTYDRATQLAAKFAVNVISLSSSYAQPGGGPHHTSSVPIDLSPPLLLKERIGDLNIQPGQTPVLYKGLFVVASGNKIKVYDAKPKTDLDGDGNPDDGIQDSNLGQDYDELWESAPLGNQISAATCAEVPGSAVRDQIFVTDDQGILYAFDAFALSGGTINPLQSTNIPPIYTIKPPQTSQWDTSLPAPGPYAPVFHDGLLYVADVQQSPTTGIVWVADPLSQASVKTGGANDWYVGGNGAQTLPIPSAGPTIGYIPVQDNSGGYDRVMYLPGRPTSALGPTGTASVTSIWMGVRGETPPPNSVFMNPGDMTVITRAARQGGLPIYAEAGLALGSQANRSLGIKLTMLYPNGDPFTDADMTTYFDGTVTQSAGTLVFPIKTALPANVSVRIDYSIDWGTNNGAATTQIIRGQLYFPDDYVNVTNANDRRRILGNVAMSPRGTIYCVLSTQYEKTDKFLNTKDGGSFYAIREDIGRGGFRLLTRYQLYPRHNIPVNQTATANSEVDEIGYEQTLEDADGLLQFPDSQIDILRGKDFSHLTFMGGPSVRGNTVYVTALGRKAASASPFTPLVPFGILLAFKAEPDVPEIRVGNIPDGFSLRQMDIDRSGNHAVPTATNDMTQGQFTYDRNEGVVRFDNLMTANRGVMVNAFSTSQPVVLRRPNAPDRLIEPDADGSKWTPLLWYAVMHGVLPTGGAFTSGGSVFVPGWSYLPNMSSGALKPAGMVMAWDANISPNDLFLQPNPDGSRKWNLQLLQYSASGSVIGPDPHALWPQLTGMTGIADFFLRSRQTKLGNSTRTFGVIGGEGSLGAWGDEGAYTFTKADFLTIDEGRLLRLDASGNPLWISSSSSSTGSADTGSTGALKPLIRPSRAYPVGSNDIVVVDPAANRVARLDLSGNELRSITGFRVDLANVPDGYKANEPTTLNSPRDVAVYTEYRAGGTQLWVHYMIADTGNKRIVDVVDKYQVNASRQVLGTLDIGVLNWHSPSNFSGKTFEYNSVSRIYDPNSGHFFLLAGIGGSLPTRVGTGLDGPTGGGGTQLQEAADGNGGVVIFDPTSPSGNVVVNRIMMPDIPANTYWNFQTGTFNNLFRQSHYKSLSNVNSVTARVVWDAAMSKSRIALMITDSSGIYEVWLQDAANDPTTDWVVRWMLPNEAYRGLRRTGVNAPDPASPVDLRATYARRLEDGDVIVVNGYYGKTLAGNDFLGEVLQIDGDINQNPMAESFDFGKLNFGFDFGMIVFKLPPITGTRGLVIPIFSDRR